MRKFSKDLWLSARKRRRRALKVRQSNQSKRQENSQVNVEQFLIRLLLRKNHIDYTYLYCQGMKDIVRLSTYADNEIIENDLLSKDDDVDDFEV